MDGLLILKFAFLGQAGFDGVRWVLPVLVLGGAITYLGMTGRLSSRRGKSDRTPKKEEGLETLKRRYAEGAMDEIEFERKLETLFENETIADAERSITDGTDSNSTAGSTPDGSPSGTESGVEASRSRRTGSRKRGRCSTRRKHCE